MLCWVAKEVTRARQRQSDWVDTDVESRLAAAARRSPELLTRVSKPPGCSSRNGVTSYTLPSITSQQSLSLMCSWHSASVIVLASAVLASMAWPAELCAAGRRRQSAAAAAAGESGNRPRG